MHPSRYHGRDPAFQKGVYSQLTGRIGLCESEDGISWTRVEGPEDLGSCLSLGVNDEAFDATHVGVGDVVQSSTREGNCAGFKMYYFGGLSSWCTP